LFFKETVGNLSRFLRSQIWMILWLILKFETRSRNLPPCILIRYLYQKLCCMTFSSWMEVCFKDTKNCLKLFVYVTLRENDKFFFEKFNPIEFKKTLPQGVTCPFWIFLNFKWEKIVENQYFFYIGAYWLKLINYKSIGVEMNCFENI